MVGGWGLVIDLGILGEDIDQGELVTLADFVVIKVMGWGDLDTAGPKAGVHVVVSNNRDLAPDQGQGHGLADEMLIALILWVYGNGTITEHGLRSGGGDDKVAVTLSQGIAEVPEVAIFFF